MIGYVTIGSNDIEKARGFYSALLGSIGAAEMMRMESFTLYGMGFDKPGVAVTTPNDKKPATVGNGMMVALVVDTRAKVDALYAKALELGGTCEGPAGLRGDEGPMAFYAGYFRDLEGNKLCVYKIGAE